MKWHTFKVALVFIGILFFNIPSVFAKTAGECLQDGNDFLREGYFDEAIIQYTRALDINPNLAKAYNNRGVAYAHEGSLSRAIADFTMALANNFKDAEAFNNRGQAYASTGNFTQALADYTQAIRNNAFYVKAYNNREVVYYQLKEYAKAWADVRTVEAIGGFVDPHFIEVLKKASGQL